MDADQVTEFRFRGNGWPGPTVAKTGDGREASMDYNDSWGKILNKHLQFRCKICPDGTAEAADLAAFDSWETRDGYPDFEERDGFSGIVARTAKGKALLDELQAQQVIAAAPLERDRLAVMQPYQERRKRAAPARLAAVKSVRGITLRLKGLRAWRNALALGRANLQEFSSTRRRCQKGADLET
ncbi:MAG: Coenzyme F420 hydrogenase/dehydrogenase, beta subunit C-terminal domain [Magnetospiraceae bacterium]